MNKNIANTKKKWVTQGVSFTPEIVAALKLESKRQDRTISWLVRTAVLAGWAKISDSVPPRGKNT